MSRTLAVEMTGRSGLADSPMLNVVLRDRMPLKVAAERWQIDEGWVEFWNGENDRILSVAAIEVVYIGRVGSEVNDPIDA